MLPKCPTIIKTFEMNAAKTKIDRTVAAAKIVWCAKNANFVDYRRFIGFAKACKTSAGQGCDLFSSKSIQTITDLPCAHNSRRSG
jgi:hypothetical protein